MAINLHSFQTHLPIIFEVSHCSFSLSRHFFFWRELHFICQPSVTANKITKPSFVEKTGNFLLMGFKKFFTQLTKSPLLIKAVSPSFLVSLFGMARATQRYLIFGIMIWIRAAIFTIGFYMVQFQRFFRATPLALKIVSFKNLKHISKSTVSPFCIIPKNQKTMTEFGWICIHKFNIQWVAKIVN